MDSNNYSNEEFSSVGIPYDDINWYDVEGQPFGIGSRFNAIVFHDAYNLIDVEGAMAVGGNFNSPRGLSVAFGKDAKLVGTGYSPDSARFLAGGNVSMGGPLVVVGHVVVGENFRAANGSTYLIGKDGTTNQEEKLGYLYQAIGGSTYWKPSDKGDHYLIPSYDVPRYIPTGRIGANLPMFFQNAKDSIEFNKECIEGLEVNGTVIDNNYEWILQGSDPKQNVFLIDVRPNGRLNKGIRADVPEGSLVIVKLRTGNNAYLQYGIFGEERRANNTLYVFGDATDIFMEVPADIWGSILAPQAMFHAHSTGGHVSGNVALRAFTVNANSGFEFHLYPFIGGVYCPIMATPAVPENTLTMPLQESMQCPVCPSCPLPEPCPIAPSCPLPEPCPIAPACPLPEPCPIAPACPLPEPCPIAPSCPVPEPCPIQQPCPIPEPCPTCPQPVSCPQCPTCPIPEPCPSCPIPEPCPSCPIPEPCPSCLEPQLCPECPEQLSSVKYIPYPVPIKCPTCPKARCPECPECPPSLIAPGIIFGCIWGCNCCKIHEWEVNLYQMSNDTKILLYCIKVACCGCFEFKVPYDGLYLLEICPIGNSKKYSTCKPIISFKNIGVSNLVLK